MAMDPDSSQFHLKVYYDPPLPQIIPEIFHSMTGTSFDFRTGNKHHRG
jgi:hypothetical protein